MGGPVTQSFQIGDIVMSALDEATFNVQHGGTPPVGGQLLWVLCDGRDVTNSAYQALTNNQHVPDLVGRYPRGADVGGKTGVSTPNVGGQMGDTFTAHAHTLIGGTNDGRWGVMGDAQGGGNNQVARTGYSGNIGTDAQGGNETRPKTTIVNFFIRIN